MKTKFQWKKHELYADIHIYTNKI